MPSTGNGKMLIPGALRDELSESLGGERARIARRGAVAERQRDGRARLPRRADDGRSRDSRAGCRKECPTIDGLGHWSSSLVLFGLLGFSSFRP
jgi:hypothetical protein